MGTTTRDRTTTGSGGERPRSKTAGKTKAKAGKSRKAKTARKG